MPTLQIGSAVSEKTGTQVKGFSFIVMGDVKKTSPKLRKEMHSASWLPR